jgi:Tetracyclin repressor-like, C-terminal domain
LSKTELIGAALRHLRLEHQPQLSGDTRKDLITLVVAMRKQYARVGGMSILGSCMLDDTASNGELIHIVRASTVLPRREQFASVIKAGIAAGRLKPDTDPERAVSAIIGSFYADYIAGRSTSGRKWAESIVDIVLEGISR